MINVLLALFGKSASKFSETLNLGSGSTWPGHIALSINKNFIRQTIGKNIKIVLVAGTNGKTTTASLISHILSSQGSKVTHNKAGANQLNGVSSAIIDALPLFSSSLRSDFLILEVDENVLPVVLEHLTPDYIICLNLFRDQLDRYGEIDSIIGRWRSSFGNLTNKTTLILNADDPQVAELAKNLKLKAFYFGLNDKNQEEIEHGADSTYCPKCSHSLDYETISFSHLGNWNCPSCGLKRPGLDIERSNTYPLLGTYNKYNTLASVLFAKSQGISDKTINSALKTFKPAFGRQEEMEIDGKKVKFFLSKNPTSFNESLSTINSLKPKNLLIVLNDKPVDGTDVSWIYDIDFENLLNENMNVFVSGDRAFDMVLRLRYSNILKNLRINESLSKCIDTSLQNTPEGQTLYILPTYSAMLDVRKILTGRRIL